MKGQMFVVAMIFLVGLIFAVQNSLSAYSFLDLGTSLEKNDLHLSRSIKGAFQEITATPLEGCGEGGKDIQELEAFLERKFLPGTQLGIHTSLDCSRWGAAPLNLTVRIKSVGTESEETFVI